MEVLPGLHWVDGIWESKVYVWLPPTRASGVVVIDTGMPGRAGLIWRYLSRLGYGPEAVREIWLTHGDFDHAGSTGVLKARSGARVVAHKADVPLIDGRAERQLGRLPGSGTVSYERLANWAIRHVAHYRPVQVERAVGDGEDPSGSGQEASGWRVVHTPGHTPGSICFYYPPGKIVLVGDALRHRLGRVRRPLGLFTADVIQGWESARRIAALDFEVCCFGHGLPIRENARQRVVADLGLDRGS